MVAKLAMCVSRSAPEHQKCCTCEAANQIRQQIIPTGMAARKIDLMPFIQYANQQCASDCNDQPAIPLQSDSQSDTTGKYGEDCAMKKLIPRRGEQINGNRLRTPKKQIQYYPQHQQCSSDA